MRSSFRFFVVLTLAVIPWTTQAVTVTSHPFTGITYVAHEQQDPYPLAWYLVRIDPDAPGIRLITTEPNGEAPEDTDTENTREFAKRTRVQVAVNANFFGSLDEPVTDVLSLAVSNGQRYSPWAASLPWGINFDPDNHATVIHRDENDHTGYGSVPPVELFNAVAGNVRVVAEGKCVAPENSARHPRTAAGLTKEGEILLLVVDGRHPAHSRGVTYRELAEILLQQGAWEAINLDGGGSSTLVIANPKPRVVNVPMPVEAPEGAPLPPFPLLRTVGNNIGIYANPAE